MPDACIIYGRISLQAISLHRCARLSPLVPSDDGANQLFYFSSSSNYSVPRAAFPSRARPLIPLSLDSVAADASVDSVDDSGAWVDPWDAVVSKASANATANATATATPAPNATNASSSVSSARAIENNADTASEEEEGGAAAAAAAAADARGRRATGGGRNPDGSPGASHLRTMADHTCMDWDLANNNLFMYNWCAAHLPCHLPFPLAALDHTWSHHPLQSLCSPSSPSPLYIPLFPG